MELGLGLAGVRHRTVAAIEIEAFAIANLVAKMEQRTLRPFPIWSNLKTFDPAPFRGRVDLITGGYPCQPFSTAGKRKGAEDSRHLWPYLSKIIDAIKPLWCFFENVEGHLSLGYGEVYRSLRDMGYTVESGIFSSQEAGGSHQRKRLFILAKLEYSKSIRTRERRDKNSEREGFEIIGSGAAMADTDINDECNQSRTIQRETEEAESEKHRKGRNQLQRKRSRAISSSESSEPQPMAHTTSSRLREAQQDSESKESHTRSRIPIAPPGPYQYEWEAPRQSTKDELKSDLGLPVTDGYDYRTDLLRSLGNGVDPYTAAIAWKVLSKKIQF